MFGFVLGTMCLIGLGVMASKRRRWRAYAMGYGHAGGCGPMGGYGGPAAAYGYGPGWSLGHTPNHTPNHGGPWGHDSGGPPWAGNSRSRWWRGGVHLMLRRLQTTPEQETVIRESLDELVTTVQQQREELGSSRRDVAEAIRAESFDETAMGELFGRHDDRITEVRKAVMEALGRIHAVLDDTQRERLAELIDRGQAPWHPFRGGAA